jgi:hypothetical protein
MQREDMELLSVRAALWRMEIELLREIHRSFRQTWSSLRV